ncbi:LOW QUALITY PROTEIN: cilia- and flagella-associated protein 68 [Leptosomus discolor]
MSKICLYTSLHGSLMRATGHGELWMDWDSTSQYGWRCTTNENDYSEKTLMGNWNEGYFGLPVRQKTLKAFYLYLAMLSGSFSFQYSHCFETTYSSDYKGKHQRIKRFEEPHWFPGHHPELEPPSFNPTAQSCYTIDHRKTGGLSASSATRISFKQKDLPDIKAKRSIT